ncbi:MAG: response regulator transcription factor [Steroidobacteraceae bacterium]
MAHRILVIEDERDIAALVTLHLQDLGFEVSSCGDGVQGLERALGGRWDLMVLDLSLPGMDGIEICRRVRLRGVYLPILMLTARTTEADRVFGLDMGADDYLTKPFGIVEFIARVKAILRRVRHSGLQLPGAARLLRVADLQIDLDKREARRADRVLDLTAREFDLLAHLAHHRGRVFTRTQLLDQVWGLRHDAYEHTVSSHINRLRAKIEPDPAAPSYLLTVWGVGYRLAGD